MKAFIAATLLLLVTSPMNIARGAINVALGKPLTTADGNGAYLVDDVYVGHGYDGGGSVYPLWFAPENGAGPKRGFEIDLLGLCTIEQFLIRGNYTPSEYYSIASFSIEVSTDHTNYTRLFDRDPTKLWWFPYTFTLPQPTNARYVRFIVESNYLEVYYPAGVGVLPGGAALIEFEVDGNPVVGNSTAAIIGNVNPGGVYTTAWFEWGMGSRFDQSTPPVVIGNGSTNTTFTNYLTGLIQGIPYRYRTVASNALGVVTRTYDTPLLSPLLTPIGANPLTNTWGTAYVEPGATATGFSVSLAAGRAHTVALRAGNTISVWGDNSLKQTNSPASATNLIAIAAGQNHVVAARANGTVVAWGENTSSQTNVISAASNVVAVAAGEAFCLALRTNGTVVGWGDSFYGQTNAPTGTTNISAITAGQRHCLALRNTGTITAWGYNGFGQTNVPAGATSVKAIAAGSGHSLALKTDGSVLVWGLNSYFQTNLPPTVTNVVAIAAGFYHSLALRADGTVVAWGAGTNNTGATPHFGQSVVPASATNVIAIAAGYYHSLAMRADGSVIAWGAGTTSTGSFPNFGQAIIPSGLEAISPTLFASGTVNTNLTGNYLINYTVTNAFGGVATTARNVFVTAPPPSPTLVSSATLPGGLFQFNFTNATPISFTVLASTNVALPSSNWTVLGAATVLSPGVYQFTDSQATNFPRRFYQVRSP